MPTLLSRGILPLWYKIKSNKQGLGWEEKSPVCGSTHHMRITPLIVKASIRGYRFVCGCCGSLHRNVNHIFYMHGRDVAGNRVYVSSVVRRVTGIPPMHIASNDMSPKTRGRGYAMKAQMWKKCGNERQHFRMKALVLGEYKVLSAILLIHNSFM